MVYHVLNGDAMTDRFRATGLHGETIVMRECLIEGNLEGETLADFIHTRAGFISDTYNDKDRYYTEVAPEFEKIVTAPDGSEFNLWFEYDLFCQVNMWFVLSLLYKLPIKTTVYVVYPSYLERSEFGRWSGYGPATTDDMKASFGDRILFEPTDLQLGNALWIAYKNNDLQTLHSLSEKESACFPYLHEVVLAHIERFPSGGQRGRPERVLEEIIDTGTKDFHSVCVQFWKRESIYGFGDDQVKTLYDKVVRGE